ncbi:hypothetical protein lerEdw1_018526 [Lerista edwardsae]|nr:hypothetical protein lerEdw1_018526 [Lerista edwardsae]
MQKPLASAEDENLLSCWKNLALIATQVRHAVHRFSMVGVSILYLKSELNCGQPSRELGTKMSLARFQTVPLPLFFRQIPGKHILGVLVSFPEPPVVEPCKFPWAADWKSRILATLNRTVSPGLE